MIDIVMPGVGAGTTHGKILQWLKKEGDTVVAGDILAEIETDKAVIELEAFDDGVLKQILVEAGDEEVEIGARLAVLEPEGASAADDTPAGSGATVQAGSPESASSPEPAGAPEPTNTLEAARAPAMEASTAKPAVAGNAGASTPGATASDVHVIDRIFASPSARRLARERGIDLATLEGSGPRGRIVRIDIERAEAQSRPEIAATRAAQPARTEPAARAQSAMSGQRSNDVAAPESEFVPHSSMRKAIARRLVESNKKSRIFI